ncbi:hypothetical protein GCM10009733_001830 [Nonomuraea maheshkhaliensis]|uniref:Uncharacterized protein n=1 Tax=Nonomuraea maheshkhaliensis TaxID=419590 RepID=A0ABN2EMR3_9ACTN
MLETLAVTGSTPSATSVGNVISEPDPTTALMAPATIPAAQIAASSHPVTQTPRSDRSRVDVPGQGRGGSPFGRVLTGGPGLSGE